MFRVALASKWHVHASGYATEVKEIPGVVITAVWDEQPERGREWAEQLGTDFEPEFLKLISRRDVDGVMICSPTSMHAELIIAAAEAGKHIFIEKVLTFTRSEAQRVAEAVKRNGVIFAISYPRRSWASNLYIKQALDAGMIGSPTLFLARTSHNGATANWLPASFFDVTEAGGGAMMDFGAHPMYLARWMLGKPVRITSMFNSFTGKPLEDNAVSIIEFENKALAIIQTNFVCDRCPNNLEMHGTLGSLFYEDASKPIRITAPDAPVDENGCLKEGLLPDELPTPWANWVDVCMNGGQVLYGIDDAVELSEMMEAAYLAFKEKRTVEFSELK